MEQVISPRMRWKEVLAVLGISKTYGSTLVRRGLLHPHKESRRFTWFLRSEVMALATGGSEPSATINNPAPKPAETPMPRIINEPQTSPKRRGRPRKAKLEVR